MYVSIAIVRAIVDELHRRGVPRSAFYARTGLDPAMLADSALRIPVSRYEAIVDAALALSSKPALGLHVGESAPAGAMHVVGHLLVNSGSMREAIGLFLRYSPLIFEGAVFRLTEEGNEARFSYEHPSIGPAYRAFDAEVCLTVVLAMGLRFTSSDQRPPLVRFQHAAPPYLEEYARIFGPKCVFEQPVNELVFDRRALDVPQIHRDEPVAELLKQRAEHLLAHRNSEERLVERLRDLLRYENDLGALDVDRLAQRLAIHPRSLQRRLKDKGLSLSVLVDEARRDAACTLLRVPNASVKDVAYRLGFSEPSAFHRAFKRWTGMTPAQYRGNTLAVETTSPGTLAAWDEPDPASPRVA